jgi:hypothetical protein
MARVSIKNIVWNLVFVLFPVGICSAQSVLYFPQFVDGSQTPLAAVGWTTALTITNPSAPGTPPATGTITLSNDDGTSMNITLLDENGAPAPNTFQLAGGQTKVFLSPQSNANGGLLPFNSGFAAVTSDLPVRGSLVINELNSSGPSGMAGIPASAVLTAQATVAAVNQSDPNDPQNTGVAIANPGANTATITFLLLDQYGNSVAPQVTRMLAANNHTAFLVTDLFPNAAPNILGTLRITSDNPVASMALLFQGPRFASLPMFILP